MSQDLLALLAGKPILLWCTDRSRYETGLSGCPFERFLRYHFGPHGYGVEKAAQKVPLATGQVYHAGLAHVMAYCRDKDQLPPPSVVDDAVQLARDEYHQILDSRGLLHWSDDSAQQDKVVQEQDLLCEGLIRSWTMWKLPEVLRDWRIVYVEEEYGSVWRCTCGVGDRLGAWTDHVLRGCEGILAQTRADFVGAHRVSRDLYSYHEYKGTAENNIRFRETYETTMQPYLGTLGMEDTLGIEVGEIFVHGLIKGKYTHEYNPVTKDYDGPEYQDSRLVYAYCDTSTTAGVDNWAVKYSWKNELGETKKLSRSYRKRFLSDYGDYQEYLNTFADELRPQVLHTIGPLPHKAHIRRKVLRAWEHEEVRIRWALHQFVDLVMEHGGDWAAEPVQAFLDQEFPKTFDCQRFGGRWKCHYIPVCHEHVGWQDPMGLLGFVPRRPHHLPEELQAVQRGCLPERVATDSYEE